MKSYNLAFKIILRRKRKNGMSILVALLIVTTLVTLASVVLKISSDEIDISMHDMHSMQAYYAAESGLLHAKTVISNDSNFSGTLFGTIENELNEKSEQPFYKTNVIRTNAGEGVIISNGSYMDVKRKLCVKIKSFVSCSFEKPSELYTED